MSLAKYALPPYTGSKTFGHLQPIHMPGGLIPYGGTYLRTFKDPEKYQWCKDTFVLKDNDILLASYPKCGHHWLQKICMEIIKKNHNGKYASELYKTGDIGSITCPLIKWCALQMNQQILKIVSN